MPPTQPTPAVRMQGIVKRFGETLALGGVDFELLPGEIHALLGENGAGKSTLMHVLAGLTSPTAGHIEVRGQPVRFRSTREAAACGIGMVHQHFTLVESFTVAENLALALPRRTPFLLPRRSLATEALALAERLGWKLEPDAPVWQLPVGLRQRLEIVKVLAQNPDILIFDEPTAVLAPVELQELFEVLDRLRTEGKSLVFISHKLNEVLRLCDRVTVLRQGRNAGRVDTRETSPQDLARRMVGATPESRDLIAPQPPSAPAASTRAPVLQITNLQVRGERGTDAVNQLSLEMREGEILGLAGVDGNGQAELAEAILGLRPLRGGEIRFDDTPLPNRDQQRRIGYIPQDRKRTGLAPGMTVRDNLILELQQDPEAAVGPWLRWRYLDAAAAEMRQAYDVRASGLDQPADTLSGGNQQKIVVARALYKQPRLLVAVNPTRGVDVVASAFVHAQLRELRARGAALLLISTELDEVLALADRVGVLYEGRLMGVVPPDTPRETLGLMMGGHPAPQPDDLAPGRGH